MDDLWAFFSDPRNQATLKFLGTAITAVAGAAWALIRYAVTQPEAAQPTRSTVRAQAGGIDTGREATLRSSRRRMSGAQTILLLLVVVGTLVLVAGLAGDRIAAVGSNVVGGDVENSTIIIGPSPQEAKP